MARRLHPADVADRRRNWQRHHIAGHGEVMLVESSRVESSSEVTRSRVTVAAGRCGRAARLRVSESCGAPSAVCAPSRGHASLDAPTSSSRGQGVDECDKSLRATINDQRSTINDQRITNGDGGRRSRPLGILVTALPYVASGHCTNPRRVE